jgi:hypothetical protein
MAAAKDLVIGIDLGTSNSCVSILRDGKVEIMLDEEGSNIQPSVVHFQEDGTVMVGRAAKAQMITSAENTVYSSKRLIGRKYFSAEVKKAKAICPYEIIEGQNRSVLIKVRGREYTLQEISAFILKKMKKIAENHLKQEVRKAVVTVPAHPLTMATTKRGRDDDDAEAAMRAERKATITEAGLRILTAINQVITQLPADDDTLKLMHKIRDLATLEFASTYLRDYETRCRKKRVTTQVERISWVTYMKNRGVNINERSQQPSRIDIILGTWYADRHNNHNPPFGDDGLNLFTCAELDEWAMDAIKEYNEECSCKHPDFGWIPVELPKQPQD